MKMSGVPSCVADMFHVEVFQVLALLKGLFVAVYGVSVHLMTELATRAAFELAVLLPGVDGEFIYNLSFVKRWARERLDVIDGGGRRSTSILWYRGIVYHKRWGCDADDNPFTDGVDHAFTHVTRMAMVSLDRPPRWFVAESIMTRGSLGSDGAATGCRRARWLSSEEVLEMLQIDRKAELTHEVWLLCMPPSASYMINPIAIYYCFQWSTGNDGRGRRRLFPFAVAEVTSEPWEDRVRFVFNVDSGECIPKCLHVSPFMQVEDRFWRLHTAMDAEMNRLTLVVDLLGDAHRDKESVSSLGTDVDYSTNDPVRNQRLFHASLSLFMDEYQCRTEKLLAVKETETCAAERQSDERRTVVVGTGSLWMMLQRGFHPHRACFAIYLNALQLLLKGAVLHSHPQFDRLAEIATRHNEVAVRCQKQKLSSRCIIDKLPRPPWPWGVY